MKKIFIIINIIITLVIPCIILNITQIKTIEVTVLSANNNTLLVEDTSKTKYKFNYDTDNIIINSKSKI